MEKIEKMEKNGNGNGNGKLKKYVNRQKGQTENKEGIR